MATNKNALIRYKVLDSCFRNPGKRYYIEDLISACEKILREIDPSTKGISRRQIFDDIRFMESEEGWGIELDRNQDGKRVFYRYSDIKFSINNMPLNEVEVNQLKDAMHILTQFKGMPQFEWMNEILPKLQQGVTGNQSTPAVIEFDSNQYLKGIEHIGTLYNAIFYKKVLIITYKPFESDTSFNLVIHPYFLKQYNNRWFLFGYYPEKDKYDWNLAIDRMEAIKEVGGRYHKNTVIDWQEYFEDIVGVTKPEGSKPQKVVLHFTPVTGKYIETKPLHGSQKSNWIDEQTLEVSLQVILNYELERLILSYADNVKVVSPVALKKTLQKRLQQALAYYE